MRKWMRKWIDERNAAWLDEAERRANEKADAESRMTVHPRSPLGALVLSIVLPGLGSMYAGAGAAGMLILVLYLLARVWLGVAGVPAALLLAVGIAVWGIFHARRAAIRWNSRRGIVS